MFYDGREQFTEQEIVEEIKTCLAETPSPVFEGEDFEIDGLPYSDSACFYLRALGSTFLVTVVEVTTG